MNDIDEILEAFELLGDWEQRYAYLIELGERLETMPETMKRDANKVKECMSEVYVDAHPNPQQPKILDFSGDCDTAIIKGVVALLVRLFSGKSPQDIIDLDVDHLFTGLKLEEHLSPNRHVGVYAIVNKMKSQVRLFLR